MPTAARILFLFLFLLVQFHPSPLTKKVTAQSSTPPWVDAQARHGILFILWRNPTRIQRYDMAARAWLGDIQISGFPTAFRVGEEALFVAFGNQLYRMGLDGQNPVLIYTSLDTEFGQYQTQINEIIEHDQFLFLTASSSGWSSGGSLYSINKDTGTRIAGPSNSAIGISIAPNRRMIFAHQHGQSPSDFFATPFNADGTFGTPLIAPYHGSYPYAWKTWVFPDETKIIENNGIVYNSDALYKDNFAGYIIDLVFAGQTPVALREKKLLTFSVSDPLIEQGVYSLARSAYRIFIDQQTVFALGADEQQKPTIEIVPLQNITPPVPGDPVDPGAISYYPKDMALGNDGILYLLSSANKSIFRWSISERRYLQSIPLAREPMYMSYSPEANRLFLAYKERFLTRIDLNQSIAEVRFAVLPDSPCGITSVGGSIVAACDDSAFFYANSYSTYNMSGERISTATREYTALSWDPFRRRVYILPEGHGVDIYSFTVDESGYFSQINRHWFNNEGFSAPFRLSPDGSVFMLGTGQIKNADNLTTLYRLQGGSTSFSDGLWKGQTLFTVWNDYNSSPAQTKKIQKWNTDFTLKTSTDLQENILRIFPTDNGVLAVVKVNDKIQFTYLDDELNILGSSPLANFSTDVGTGYGYVPFMVTFTNTSIGQENTYLWDFGDGTVSADENPSHTYTKPGSYTVKLTVKNSYGEDTKIAADLVHSLQKLFMPLIAIQYPIKTFENMCSTFPMYLPGLPAGTKMTECVNSALLLPDGKVRIDFSWMLSGYLGSDCVQKFSDIGNPNMYLMDQNNNRYQMTGGGGAAGILWCMGNNYTYMGWFDFPQPLVEDPIYTFHDDDNNLMFSPITLPTP